MDVYIWRCESMVSMRPTVGKYASMKIIVDSRIQLIW